MSYADILYRKQLEQDGKPTDYDYPDYHELIPVIMMDDLSPGHVFRPFKNDEAKLASEKRRQAWAKDHPGHRWNSKTEKWEITASEKPAPKKGKRGKK